MFLIKKKAGTFARRMLRWPASFPLVACYGIFASYHLFAGFFLGGRLRNDDRGKSFILVVAAVGAISMVTALGPPFLFLAVRRAKEIREIVREPPPSHDIEDIFAPLSDRNGTGKIWCGVCRELKPIRAVHCDVCGCMALSAGHSAFFGRCIGACNRIYAISCLLLIAAYSCVIFSGTLVRSQMFACEQNPGYALRDSAILLLVFIVGKRAYSMAQKFIAEAASNMTCDEKSKPRDPEHWYLWAASSRQGHWENPFNLGIVEANMRNFFSIQTWVRSSQPSLEQLREWRLDSDVGKPTKFAEALCLLAAFMFLPQRQVVAIEESAGGLKEKHLRLLKFYGLFRVVFLLICFHEASSRIEPFQSARSMRAIAVLFGVFSAVAYVKIICADPRVRKDKGKDESDRPPCRTCYIRRPLRSKHCPHCNKCVPRFDHHCSFTYCCIGKGNHFSFVLFLIFVMIQCVLPFIAAANSSHAVMVICSNHVTIFFASLTLPATFVGYLLIQQFRGIWAGMTYNERVNVARYEHFWKNGEFVNPFTLGSGIANMHAFFCGKRIVS